VGGPGGRGTNLNVDAFVVPASGKNKAIAWDFAKYLLQDKYAVQMMRDVGWIVSKKGVDYSSVYVKEPHFQQAIDRPAGFKLTVSPPAVSWAEVYTNLASALTVAYTDPSMMDNKPKIMSWLAAQADAANKVLQNNKEY
jgi:ABC-type glycerol-3-phosphate transport system substrate-binding protein